MSLFKKFIFIIVFVFMGCPILFSEDFNAKVINDTAVEKVISYTSSVESYTATICYNKLYKDARITIIFSEPGKTECDFARIEYFLAYHTQRYFKMYNYEISDRKMFYSINNLSKCTFHIYYRE